VYAKYRESNAWKIDFAQKKDMLSGSMGATRPSRMVTVAANSPTVTMMVARIVSPTRPPHDDDM